MKLIITALALGLLPAFAPAHHHHKVHIHAGDRGEVDLEKQREAGPKPGAESGSKDRLKEKEAAKGRPAGETR